MNKTSSAQPFLYGKSIEQSTCALEIIKSSLNKRGTLEVIQSPPDLILEVSMCLWLCFSSPVINLISENSPTSSIEVGGYL